MLLYNPPGQTDSFVLYIKTLMLMSRIKAFNIRCRGRHYAGEAEFFPAVSSPDGEGSGAYDVRESGAGGDRAQRQRLAKFISDWHLVAFLGTSELLTPVSARL